MISRDKDDKLVIIYFYICDKSEELQFYCERFSNNSEPTFTDQEIMTLYLYIIQHEGHTKVKHIHRFASEWLPPWFPKLGSYQAFNANPIQRILRRSEGLLPKGMPLALESPFPKGCLTVWPFGKASSKGTRDSLGESLVPSG